MSDKTPIQEHNKDIENEGTPAEITQIAENTIQNLLPQKSKIKYTTAYNNFIQWTITKNIKSFSENTMLAYFTQLSQMYKPTTVWATYSMLKTTLNINNDINIYKYSKLMSFMKQLSKRYQPKKSKTLTPEDIKRFLNEAEDNKHLFTKVTMIFGISGACRRDELTKITINDVQDKESVLLIKIPTTKNGKPRSFIIDDEFYTICKKYMALRPNNVETSRFFLNYHNGQCTKQPVGINKFGKVPEIIASYLKLPEAHLYTGHAFRRTSATLLADSGADITTIKRHGGWKSSTVAEGYIEDSFQNKKKIYDQITRSITHNTSSSTSQTSKTKVNIGNQNFSFENYTHNKENIQLHTRNIENVDISNEHTPQTKTISITFTNCTITNANIFTTEKKD